MAIHKFNPKIYYNAFGTYTPVLRISDGDTVITSTVDNAGRDAADRQVTRPGNPLTGPFYINDAEPGDTLAVHLEKVQPNRRIGRSSTVISPNVIDPEYIVKIMKIENITMPVLVLVAEKDHITPPDAVREFFDRIPSKDKKMLLSDKGHIGLTVSGKSHREMWPEAIRWVVERSG